MGVYTPYGGLYKSLVLISSDAKEKEEAEVLAQKINFIITGIRSQYFFKLTNANFNAQWDAVKGVEQTIYL
jgi:hypothetical protein